MSDKQGYEFDKKLTSEDIKYIDRNIYSTIYENMRCDRCGHSHLKYVNTIRIEDEYYELGDDCYASIRAILSEIRGVSLHFIKLQLEDRFEQLIRKKYYVDGFDSEDPSEYKYDADYKEYESLKWDVEYGTGLPTFKQKRLEVLKKKFEA